MKVSEFVMLILMMGFFLIGTSIFATDSLAAYGKSDATISNLKMLNQTYGINTRLSNFSSSLTPQNITKPDPITAGFGLFSFITATIYNTGVLLIDTPNIMFNILGQCDNSNPPKCQTGLLTALGIPSWVISFATVALLALFLFALYRSVGKADI